MQAPASPTSPSLSVGSLSGSGSQSPSLDSVGSLASELAVPRPHRLSVMRASVSSSVSATSTTNSNITTDQQQRRSSRHLQVPTWFYRKSSLRAKSANGSRHGSSTSTTLNASTPNAYASSSASTSGTSSSTAAMDMMMITSSPPSSPSQRRVAGMFPGPPDDLDAEADGRLRKMIIEASQFQEAGSMEEAVELYLSAAQQGSVTGTLMTGLALRHGWGVEADAKLGFDYIKKAADACSALALYELGVSYRYGWGVEKDKKLAFAMFLEAARRNEIEAMLIVGRAYWKGKGVKRNKFEAAAWLRAAEAAGAKLDEEYEWVHKAKYFEAVPSTASSPMASHTHGSNGNNIESDQHKSKSRSMSSIFGGFFRHK